MRNFRRILAALYPLFLWGYSYCAITILGFRIPVWVSLPAWIGFVLISIAHLFLVPGQIHLSIETKKSKIFSSLMEFCVKSGIFVAFAMTKQSPDINLIAGVVLFAFGWTFCEAMNADQEFLNTKVR